MRRIRELISIIQKAHPTDAFFANIESTWETSRQARAQYAAYDRAMRMLDTSSWIELKTKAVRHFLDHRKGQLKQGFFNQLNEVFAYELLARRGCTDVQILQEKGKTIPDIGFKFNGVPAHCEVKTIGISEEQLARWEKIQAFSGSIYSQLSDGFLKKLTNTLTSAQSQISSQGTTGLIYLIVLFDDFTLMYYERYREQILNTIQAHEAPNVYLKIGLLGQRRIQKGSHA